MFRALDKLFFLVCCIMLGWARWLSVGSFNSVFISGTSFGANIVAVVCSANILKFFLFYSSLTLGFSDIWLIEHGSFELISRVGNVVWYLLSLGVGLRLLVFSGLSAGKTIPSIETLFRNARWLEREVAEMSDIWFTGKRDRRALFLVALLYWGVLRKSFPTSGFSELRLWPSLGQVVALHVNWQDLECIATQLI